MDLGKILIDTNILVSAVLCPHSRVCRVVHYVARCYQLCLTEQIIGELRQVIARKAPHKLALAEQLLSELAFVVVEPVGGGVPVVRIRDETDQPIVDAAIWAHVDLILTNDRDFETLAGRTPACLRMKEFIEREWFKPDFACVLI